MTLRHARARPALSTLRSRSLASLVSLASLASLASLTACAVRATPAARTLPAPGSASAPGRDLARARDAVAAAPPAARGEGMAPRDPRVVNLDVIRLRAVQRGPGDDGVEVETVSTAQLFARANAAAAERRPDEALALFRQLANEFPESLYAPAALFDIGALLEARGESDAAIAALRELVERYPSARESIDGHLLIAALQAERRQWPESLSTLRAALGRSNLTHADRLEALARQGYAQLELGQLDAAEASLEAALAAWRLAPPLEDHYFVAMASYYRGEVVHRRFAAQPVEVPDDDLRRDLDKKERLAAEAYDRWRAALDYRNAYWATAAGFQMSQIFLEYWQAIVTAPYPAALAAAARPPYVAEVHRRVAANLAKALEGHDMNVALGRAFGVETAWSRASADQATRIRQILADEAQGRFVSPAQAPASAAVSPGATAR